MHAAGIRFLQGLAFQFIPSPGERFYKRKFRYTGKRSDPGIWHLARNAFFEPSLTQDVDASDSCLRRIQEAFRSMKPAIVGVHRVNFMGSLDENNRRENLKQFQSLLVNIKKKWPDVEFLSTDQLGRIMANKKVEAA
jgi:hypothetical protein